MRASADPPGVRPATPKEWQQAFALLDAATELPTDARGAWLRAQDARLAPMVEALLRDEAALSTGSFLSRPARLPPVPLGPGSTIGPYRLLRPLGNGGMASVWLAERADGLLRRQVALKLPHTGVGLAGGFAERLARERDILAGLVHPNIARLYDAGIADDGRPYLALELIEGAPIDAHSDAAGLGVRERVALLVQVARAVAHAHTQLVVHRDLKPSNILVDARGEAHLLDFGIAKLVDAARPAAAGAGDETVVFGAALTPDYASPEQIRGEAIGTGSDVYSLGIVAFELLAGARPYRLKAGSAVRCAEALAQVVVPKASTVATDPARRRALRGDLDAILAHCLAPAPAERYPTVAALADDLERHLRGEPVRARPPHPAYLISRWIGRHRLPTALGAAVVVALAGGRHAEAFVLLALAAGAGVALWQRNLARRQSQIALAALARAEEVKRFIASIFTQAVPRSGAGGPVAAADLLRAAAHRVESDLKRQPDVQAELAALIGDSFNELGEMRAALDWLPKAVALCRDELGTAHPWTLQCRWRLAEAANTVGELAVSAPLLAPLVRDLRLAQPPQTELLVRALQSQAFVATKHGREAEALAALEEAVAAATAAFGEAGAPSMRARSALSNTLVHFGRPEAALAALAPSVGPAQAAYGDQRPHPLLLTVERNHGNALAYCGRPRQAARLLRQVLEDQRALDAGDSIRVRVDMTLLATALLLRGRFEEAQALLTEACALHERLTGGANHEAAQVRDWLALVGLLRGDAVAALGHADAARQVMQGRDEAAVRTQNRAATCAMARVLIDGAQAIAEVDALLAPGSAMAPAMARRLRRHRVLALRRAGRIDGARAAADEALADAAGDALEHGLLLVERARTEAAAGATDAARSAYAAALEVWDGGEVDGPELVDAVRDERTRLG